MTASTASVIATAAAASPPPQPGPPGGGGPAPVPPPKDFVSLKVTEAYTRDVGRGIARVDYDAMDAMKCDTGDIVELLGPRRTVAKCLPLYPSDEGKGIIRIDGLIRRNAGTKIDDQVTVRKVGAPPAARVSVSPLEPVPPVEGRYIADMLEGIPITKGDDVIIPYFGGRIALTVKGYTPDVPAVLIHAKTEFVIEGRSGRASSPPKRVRQVHYAPSEVEANKYLAEGWSVVEYKVVRGANIAGAYDIIMAVLERRVEEPPATEAKKSEAKELAGLWRKWDEEAGEKSEIPRAAPDSLVGRTIAFLEKE
jgi:hypothetical protein